MDRPSIPFSTSALNSNSAGSHSTVAGCHTCRRLALFLSLLFTVLSVSSAPVLAGTATGRIAGVLKDPSGAVVPGGQVDIKNLESGATKSTTSDASGRYLFDAVPVGLYQVSAVATGFAVSVRDRVAVSDGDLTMIGFELSISRSTTSVRVTGQAITADSETVASAKARTSDTASLLANTPGVSLYSNGGVSSLPAVHGIADDKVRVTVDGMSLISACANHMNPPLSYIDPTNVGAITVFAGITPVSAGGDSIGGSILVNSPGPEFAAAGRGSLVKGEAGTFYRSNGMGYGANLAFTIAGENLTFGYAGAIAHADNYAAAADFRAAGLAATGKGWLAGNEVGSSRYESQNHYLGLALRHKAHLVEVGLGMQNIPYQGFPNQRMDMTSNRNIRANLRYSGQYEWGALEARIYGDLTRHKMDFGSDKQYFYGSAATILAPGMPMDTKGLNLGAVVKADIRLSGRDVLRVGLDSQRYRLNDWWPPSPSVLPPGYTSGGMAPDTFVNIRDGQRDRIGVFSEWEARWSPRWITLLGLRSDTVMMNTGPVQGYNGGMMYNGMPLYPATTFNTANRQRTDANFDATALARYAPKATLDFEFGYARKAHSPNLYERYAWSTNRMAMEMVNFAGDGNYYVGNLGLKPEVANTVSVSGAWHDRAKERRGLSITPYFTSVHDYINAIRCPTAVCGSSDAVVANLNATTGFVYLQFANQNARLYGVDISGHALLASTSYGRFTATAVVNIVRGENRTTGDNLYNIMPVSTRVSVIHRIRKWTNTIEQQLVDAKRNVSQARNELRTGGYGLLNLRTSYDLGRFRLDTGMENVLNKFYASPLGGAYVGQGATMSGPSIPWGIPVPGQGRSLYVGMTVRFSTD